MNAAVRVVQVSGRQAIKAVDHRDDFGLGNAIGLIAFVQVGAQIVFDQHLMRGAVEGATQDMRVTLHCE